MNVIAYEFANVHIKSQPLKNSFFFANLFITNLKKESDTIRNCSSKSPSSRGCTENRSLHFSSERFLSYFRAYISDIKQEKHNRIQARKKHCIHRSSGVSLRSIFNVKSYIENKLILSQYPKVQNKMHINISKGHLNIYIKNLFPCLKSFSTLTV